MNAKDPEKSGYTFDDYLSDRLSDDEWRVDWGGEEALARVATRLYRARKSRGLSQAEVADRAGTKQPNISAIENGEGNPTVRTVGRLAAALRMDIAELFAGVDRHGVYRQTGFENLRPRISLTGTTGEKQAFEDHSWEATRKMQRGSESDRRRGREEQTARKLVA